MIKPKPTTFTILYNELSYVHMYYKISEKVLSHSIYTVVELSHLNFYIHVNNYPVELFYINRCYTDTYMYTVDFNPPCLCYVGSNDNLTNSCRRSLKDVSLVHSGHQGVERNYAQISSCDKKNWSMYMYIHLAKIRYNCDRINDSITLKH